MWIAQSRTLKPKVTTCNLQLQSGSFDQIPKRETISNVGDFSPAPCLFGFSLISNYQEPQKPMKMSYLQKTRCFLGKHDVFGKHRIFDFKQFPIHSFNSSSVLKRSQKHHLNLRISHRPPLLHSQRNQLRIRHSSFATPT